MSRGYFGIGVFEPKTTTNIGTLWRSAHNFGASFIFVIGARYKREPSDTTNAKLHVPLYCFKNWEAFLSSVPEGCEVVCIENSDRATPLARANHPMRAVYVLGAEDYGIPEKYLSGHQVMIIEGAMHCLNVATAGSIVMYERIRKLNDK